MRCFRLAAVWVLPLCAALVAWAQTPPSASSPPPAAALYAKILHTQIAPQRVYRVDGLGIDDEDVQITLEHGRLGLLQTVQGRTTGAVFAGQGEIFVLPPTAADRLAMTDYTGMAFLNESFNSAYFRFDDGALDLSAASLAQLLPVRPDGQAFAARWNPTVAELNRGQALRLLAGFLNHDRTPYFFARIGGERFWAFDVLVDRSRPEQVQIAAPGFTTVHGLHPRPGDANFWANVWASFPMRSARLAAANGKPGFPGPDLRVRHYDVATRIAPNLSLEGQTTVDFRARISGDRVITFHLDPRLALKSVASGVDWRGPQPGHRPGVPRSGQPLLYVQNGQLEGPGLEPPKTRGPMRSTLVAVILRRPLVAGQNYALRFRYAGNIITNANGQFGLTNRMDWYPNRSSQPATHDLSFLYPAGLTLVATGAFTGAGSSTVPPRVPLPLAPTPRTASGSLGGQAGGPPHASLEAHPTGTGFDPVPAGFQTARWVSTRPSDLAGFNLGHFQMGQATVPSAHGPIPIQVYAAPHAATAAHLARIARASAWTVEFYQQRFGPFPFPHLALTELPFPFGQGWPGLIYLAQDSFLTPAQMEDRHLPTQAQALYPLMRPHEIAHQWWGNEVAWRSYHDQWLYEALASYAALLDVDAQMDPGALHQVLAYDRSQVLRRNPAGRMVDAAGPLSLGVRLDSARFPHAYDVLVYDKGAWVMHMLRELMRTPDAGRGPQDDLATRPGGARPARKPGGVGHGLGAMGPAAPLPPSPADHRFFAFLQAFARQYQGRAASTLDFERVANRFVPARLKTVGPQGGWDWFFSEWVDGTGIPGYAISGLRAEPGDKLQGILEQSHVPPSFTMPVPLYLAPSKDCAGACPPIYLGTVVSQGPSTEFELPLPAGAKLASPPEVLVDPEQTILRR